MQGDLRNLAINRALLKLRLSNMAKHYRRRKSRCASIRMAAIICEIEILDKQIIEIKNKNP